MAEDAQDDRTARPDEAAPATCPRQPSRPI